MTVPSDVTEHVRAHFPSSDVDELLELLATVTDSPRLQRCIAFGARGDLAGFRSLCELVEIDYRDLIVAGEYSRDLRQLYDFTKPIPEARLDSDGPAADTTPTSNDS